MVHVNFMERYPPTKKKTKNPNTFSKENCSILYEQFELIGIHGKKESAPAMKEKFHFEGTTNSLKLGNNAS